MCPAVLVKNKVLLVLLSVAGSQNLLQVDLIIVLYLPHAYPDIFENGEKISVSKIFGYKWTGLKLGKDNNNLLYMIKKKSLFNTHKKDLCTVVHLKREKTKFVP